MRKTKSKAFQYFEEVGSIFYILQVFFLSFEVVLEQINHIFIIVSSSS